MSWQCQKCVSFLQSILRAGDAFGIAAALFAALACLIHEG